MNGQGEIKLFPNGSGTGFTFIAEGNITGILARVGQRLIEATGKKLMDQGADGMCRKICMIRYVNKQYFWLKAKTIKLRWDF